MPFKPRLLRFDEPHADVPSSMSPAAYAQGKSHAQGASHAQGTSSQATSLTDAPAETSPFDTVSGLEFSTLRDMPVDALLKDTNNRAEEDLFANDEPLAFLAQQLSADADRLAMLYPGDEPTSRPQILPSATQRETVAVRPPQRQRWWSTHWHRIAAAAVLVAIAGGNMLSQRLRSDGETSSSTTGAEGERLGTGESRDAIERNLALDRSRGYDQGSVGSTPARLIGNPWDTLPDGLPSGVSSPDDAGLLRELAPDDSQDFCEVSM